MPSFWLGIMLIVVFTGVFHLLQPFGYVPLSTSVSGNLVSMILPVLALSGGAVVYLLRTTKVAMSEVLGMPYIRVLRAKGLSERRIVCVHAVRNASVPIVTVVGIQFVAFLGGSIIIESLFSLPGVGQLLVTSIGARNYPDVQATVLVIAVMVIVVNLITDIVYAV